MEKNQKKINTSYLHQYLQSNWLLTKNIIDDVQLIQGTVFDTAKDNKVKVTFVCPIQKRAIKFKFMREQETQ